MRMYSLEFNQEQLDALKAIAGQQSEIFRSAIPLCISKSKEPTMKMYSLQLEDKQLDALRSIAGRKSAISGGDVPLAWVVRAAIDLYIKETDSALAKEGGAE